MVVLLAVLVVFLYRTNGDWFTRERIMEYGKSIPAAWFMTAFFFLPLVGMPISILLVVAGVRFGLWGGMGVATVGMFFHNFVAYHLVHHGLRDRLRRRIEKYGFDVPEIKPGNEIWFTLIFAAVHGPPYALKLYLLALTNISFRVYFWMGAPVYILFSLIPVGAGSAVMQLNAYWLYGTVAAITLLTLGGIWLGRRFKPVP